MTEAERIIARLVECDAAYVDHTGKQPYSQAFTSIHQIWGRFGATICGKDIADQITGKGQDPDAAIDGLLRAIRELPSEAERNKQAFQKELAKLIDKGRELGIDVDYVNPLVETAKRLAENALTDQRAGK